MLASVYPSTSGKPKKNVMKSALIVALANKRLRRKTHVLDVDKVDILRKLVGVFRLDIAKNTCSRCRSIPMRYGQLCYRRDTDNCVTDEIPIIVLPIRYRQLILANFTEIITFISTGYDFFFSWFPLSHLSSTFDCVQLVDNGGDDWRWWNNGEPLHVSSLPSDNKADDDGSERRWWPWQCLCF